MFTIFAHAGHTESTSMSAIDHCMPVIIVASIIVFILLAIIGYMLVTWQPKSFTEGKKAAVTAKKKSMKK